jgi:hypothetical protein
MSQTYNYYYDTYDIASLLGVGANVLAIEVNHTGRNPDARGGMLAELTKEGESVLASDGTWKVLRADAWAANSQAISCNSTVAYQEIFDSRKEPTDWKLAGFTDSAWQAASVMRTPGSAIKNIRAYDTPPGVLPWIKLQQSDIPLMDERFVYPVGVTSLEESLDLHYNAGTVDISDQLSKDVLKPLEYATVEHAKRLMEPGTGAARVQNSMQHLGEEWFDGVYNPSIVLDFGKVITGHVVLEVEGPASGMIDIGYTERLADGRFVNAVDEAQFADRLILRGGRQSFRAFYWKGYRYVRLNNKTNAGGGGFSGIPVTRSGGFKRSGTITDLPARNNGFTCCIPTSAR